MSLAKDLAIRLGGTGTLRTGGRYWCCCPVHGDAHDSLTIRDNKNEPYGVDFRCWSQQCKPRDIERELRRRGLLSGDRERTPIDPKVQERQAAARREEQKRKREFARWLWNRAEANAAEVERYLTECRGIDLGRIGGVPDCLRYQIDALIPETEPKQYGMAMVAAMTDALGDITAVHETFLNFSGTAKAGMVDDKFIIGAPSGGAVRLFPVAEEIGLAEGIETALSAAELHGMPCWAALNTSCLTSFMVPPSVRRVVVFADRDPRNPKTGKRAGANAAEELAKRLTQQSIACRIAFPSLPHKDFNDELIARKRSGRAA